MNTVSVPVALVTGSAARIGACIARHLHKAGYRVVVHYHHSQHKALALADELNALRPDSVRAVQADLLDLEQVAALARQTVAAWGRLDVLVNNASLFYPTPVGGITVAHWDQLLGSNARAPLFLCQHLQHALREHKGCIINIIDATSRHGLAEFTPYAMGKAALANMTRSLARALAPEVRVNGVAPGAILWPEYAGGMSEEEQQASLSRIALGRLGSPDDIANAVLFLVRDASYITGEIIKVDGGVTA
jgi:pteridine reductase